MKELRLFGVGGTRMHFRCVVQGPSQRAGVGQGADRPGAETLSPALFPFPSQLFPKLTTVAKP